VVWLRSADSQAEASLLNMLLDAQMFDRWVQNNTPATVQVRDRPAWG
jgi:hypothetical protein